MLHERRANDEEQFSTQREGLLVVTFKQRTSTLTPSQGNAWQRSKFAVLDQACKEQHGRSDMGNNTTMQSNSHSAHCNCLHHHLRRGGLDRSSNLIRGSLKLRVKIVLSAAFNRKRPRPVHGVIDGAIASDSRRTLVGVARRCRHRVHLHRILIFLDFAPEVL